MATPYLGEVRIFSFNFPPKGWAMCNGQLLPINQNQALFAILGTTYGGNGQVNFALPNLQGRVPLHAGNGFTLGQLEGEAAHTLIISEMPAHNHLVNASTTAASTGDPTGNFWAAGQANFCSDAPNSAMNPAAVGLTGGSQPHENQSPYLTLNFCIALQGVFPTQN